MIARDHCRSMAATCFNSTIWFGCCTAAEVVTQLMEEVGAVLTQQQLLEYIQESLDNCNRQPSFPGQRQQIQQPLHPTQQTQAPTGCSQPLQRHQPQQQQQQPALTLTLPFQEPSCGPGAKGPGAAPGGSSGSSSSGTSAGCGSEGGDGSSGAFVSVLLPRSRFGGSEVTVRLPCKGDMVRVSGREAENACMALVANLIRQSDEQREEMDSLASELFQTAEENRRLRAQLDAQTNGSNGAEGRTVREQYGLAGAPPLPPAATAKRLRSAASVGLAMQLQVASEAVTAGNVSTALAPVPDGLPNPHGSQSNGGFGARRLGSQSDTVAMAGLLSGLLASGREGEGAHAGGTSLLGYAVSQALSAAATGAVNKPAAAAAGLEVVGGVMALQAGAWGPSPSSLVGKGGPMGNVGTNAAADGGVIDEGAPEPSARVSEQLEAEEKGGTGTREGPEELLPARRDPSRVGVSIRKTGRGSSRGGRGLTRH
ncbi:hypothetical protein Vretimale_676 [Volvox reticuliferus]|uniref:Uncharacterized protein n=1 Tax=Volvox reticuliferus TaxID=1737510 RepID=A0A8J4FXJ2_9CHLO|nr:hypothetical protein Vretifemale_2322 [Volvox reticuliferus]GIL94483.1 hypothetical protein Vretimale_676 [Volvox reticuliferus]